MPQPTIIVILKTFILLHLASSSKEIAKDNSKDFSTDSQLPMLLWIDGDNGTVRLGEPLFNDLIKEGVSNSRFLSGFFFSRIQRQREDE